MIGRTHRFHGRGSIRRTYANGHSVRSSLLALRYSENPKRKSYRAAVVVSRKVSKSAVLRNRIRRRIYERVRILFASDKPYDLLISVYDARVADIPSAELDAELRKLLQKAKLVSAQPTTRGTLEPKD